jgi:hypothetical protein
VCHAINRLYLHKLLETISNEILRGRKLWVCYFHVFGSKYYILHKYYHTKFSTRAQEGFFFEMA